MITQLLCLAGGAALLIFAFIVFISSIYSIGPTQVGLVRTRFGKKLPGDNPIAFHGEAGYQAGLLMPGLRFKFCFLYDVTKHPWVQIQAGQIGVVIAQVGSPLPIGAKSAKYHESFGNFSNLDTFIGNGGQKGVQRPVLSPGTLSPIHPLAFIVMTPGRMYGVSMSKSEKNLTYASFGITEEQLYVTRIAPEATKDGNVIDTVGIVTTLEGEPLPAGDIASRLGGFDDIAKLEADGKPHDDAELIEKILSNQNDRHNSYQDFQKFLDLGGKIGLQHDPLLYGAYNLNPFLLKVEKVPMLVVEQGQVAVIKAYVGLPTQDTSGSEFKFGSLVRPGHRGIWQDSLRTGKYAINPRIYQAEKVLTAIIKLDWAEGVTGAHNLDEKLSPIVAKSNEGFVFKIDLQVLIHVPDTKAPRVISMVGTMGNLVNEVLQAAVGNFFRDEFGSMQAVTFIATRQHVQEKAMEHIERQLQGYEIETRGVYIQDVVLPEALVEVLTQREIANQQVETFKKQKVSQEQRVEMEKAKGVADMQAELAKSAVTVDIKANNARARIQEAEGEATYIERTGTAKGAEVRSIGLARAEAYQKQVAALGQFPTAVVNAVEALAKCGVPFVPQTLVAGGSGTDGLAAALMQYLGNKQPQPATVVNAEPPAPASDTTSK